MLDVLKALGSLVLALLALSPSLAVWGVMYYLDSDERKHERQRTKDVRSFTTNAILNRILRRD